MDIADSALIISDETEAKIDERGIKKTEIKNGLAWAENGVKLYIDGENRFLAKKRMGNFTAYVEYDKVDDGYRIQDVYSHRVSLTEDQE